MDTPLISVIVPAYNVETYISRCLDSILAQTYSNLEIIVVDDGSSDDTGRIIDEYAKNDKRVLTMHQENRGVSKARFAGIAKTHGTYIGFVDGDDYIEPVMYEKLVKNVLDERADISQCGYRMVFPDGHEDLYHGTHLYEVQDHEKGISELLRGTYIEPTLGTKIYRKNLFNKVEESPIWDDNIRINEDLLLNYLLFSSAELSVYEDECFYHYILRQGSAATAKRSIYNITDPLKVISGIKGDLGKDSPAYSITYNRYLRALIKVIEQQEYKDEAERAVKVLRAEVKNKEEFAYCSTRKLRIMAKANAYAPWVYRIIRLLYNMVTGQNKKYNI